MNYYGEEKHRSGDAHIIQGSSLFVLLILNPSLVSTLSFACRIVKKFKNALGLGSSKRTNKHIQFPSDSNSVVGSQSNQDSNAMSVDQASQESGGQQVDQEELIHVLTSD